MATLILVVVGGLLAAATPSSPRRPAAGPPRSRPLVASRLTASPAHRGQHPFPPLALIATPPDVAGGDARGIAHAADGPAMADPGDGSFWPDSSSPVRNSPSNATTGPTTPVRPNFPGWDLTKVVVPDGARQRYYLVARPTVVRSPSLPVLLVLPGRDMTPATVARASRFLGLVGQAVVVFPAGFANSWNAGYCCGVAHLAGVDDVAFLEDVVRRVLATEPGTSRRQVYIAGFSNGGRMALDMACADPGAFAGVAAVEAVAVSTCLRASPVPLIEVASTADPLLTVLATGAPKHIAGHAEITVQALVDLWRGLDGCSPATTRSEYPAMALSIWSRCRRSARVAMAVYDGGRHAWPRGGAVTPSAEEVIWDFFHGTAPPARPTRSDVGRAA